MICRHPDGSLLPVGATVAEAAAATKKAAERRQADAKRGAEEAAVLLAIYLQTAILGLFWTEVSASSFEFSLTTLRNKEGKERYVYGLRRCGSVW